MGGRAPPSRLTLHYAQRVAAGDVTRGKVCIRTSRSDSAAR